MSAYMMHRVSKAFTKFENSVGILISRLFPPGGPGLSLAGVDFPHSNLPVVPSPSTNDLWDKSILAGVQRNRRSIEKRLSRRFGNIDYVYKMLLMKKNLMACMTCGHFHEPGALCPHCYHKVIKETREISDKIQETLKLEPVEKDVIVLYENDQPSPEFFEGKRIVEMQKPRPAWFASNLMQSSTQQPDEEATEVKPKDVA